MTDEQFATVVRVDLVAPARLAGSSSAHTRRWRDRHRCLPSSVAQLRPGNYAAAKAGLIGLTGSLAIPGDRSIAP